jgi:hypothetical protein
MRNKLLAPGLIVTGVALGAGGIHVGETDDAPGAALLGLALMIGAIAFGVKLARRKA